MHPILIVALVEDRHRYCLCGAVNGKLHQLCRNCLPRMIWRRQISRSSRGVIRLQAHRRTRGASTLAAATSMLRITGAGGRS